MGLYGSSARKLKHGSANLLAGRAVVRNIFPFSFLEINKDFHLMHALQLGLLPGLFALESNEEKHDFLRAYCHIYLKEEVWAEHLIRKLEPFQFFLEVAAQSNGDIINTTKLARDVHVDHKTIQQYFSILEDTLIGFHLTAYRKSFRKRLISSPKFYFFDVGVVRTLSKTIEIPVTAGTYDYGKQFEHFIIVECYKLIQYFFPDYRISYLKTVDGWEVDLVIERPLLPLLFIEIKSADHVREDQLKHFFKIAKEFGKNAEYVCFANVPHRLKYGEITVFPWQDGIEKFLRR